ncbi:hypothetical protein [Urechidicola croceus]|uniref:Uncharacterized protein n=1 Tax=Urechidicola croceus TaxID=1850246 RepID=A0A1D8P854_9FLAO|nr:hypothetical protein [Urechidicola croceus]AOW20745.1 hypothetical protein LPB138_08680 [Urechidicola croceus]
MKKRVFTLLILALLINSCYKEDDFSPSSLSNIMSLSIENDNQLADGTSKIRAIAEFQSNFSTEENDKVTFVLDGNENEVDIRFVEINGENKKIADFEFASKTVKPTTIKAIISVFESEISKEQSATFRQAFCESIDVSSSSLTIVPDSSFTEITLTTKLARNSGVVSTGTVANTKVVDLNGIERGVLVDYKFKTDSLGIITNRFTMANDNYEGQLYAISESLDDNNNIKNDTLVLYSQN